MRPNRLEALKKKQLANNPELYGSPQTVDVDMANGHDETVISQKNAGGQGNITYSSAMLEQLKAGMETDIARLKTYGTFEQKRAAKLTLLPNYLPFVDAYMSAGIDTPNSVAVRVMIWLIDVGKIEQGLTLGLYLIKTGHQVMPTGFASDIEQFLCHNLYDWSAEQLKKEQSASPYLDVLITALLVDKWTLNGVVASKVFAIAAKNQRLKGDLYGCLRYCTMAEAINPEGEKKAGVKTLKKDTIKAIEALPKETSVARYIRERN